MGGSAARASLLYVSRCSPNSNGRFLLLMTAIYYESFVGYTHIYTVWCLYKSQTVPREPSSPRYHCYHSRALLNNNAARRNALSLFVSNRVLRVYTPRVYACIRMRDEAIVPGVFRKPTTVRAKMKTSPTGRQ